MLFFIATGIFVRLIDGVVIHHETTTFVVVEWLSAHRRFFLLIFWLYFLATDYLHASDTSPNTAAS